MTDHTETIRRSEVAEINGQVQSDDINSERARLEKIHGQVWDTDEMQRDFAVTGFAAPYIVVRRKADNVKGSLEFQHRPRLYFNFKKH